MINQDKWEWLAIYFPDGINQKIREFVSNKSCVFCICVFLFFFNAFLNFFLSILQGLCAKVILDVGINRVDDTSKPRGYRLTGDVHFPSAERKASLITPVPGGVGPMTVAMLMRNTVTLAQRASELVAP